MALLSGFFALLGSLVSFVYIGDKNAVWGGHQLIPLVIMVVYVAVASYIGKAAYENWTKPRHADLNKIMAGFLAGFFVVPFIIVLIIYAMQHSQN